MTPNIGVQTDGTFHFRPSSNPKLSPLIGRQTYRVGMWQQGTSIQCGWHRSA
jgi:hypothetical protein